MYCLDKGWLHQITIDFNRLWHEVKESKTNLHATDLESARHSGSKWFAYNKGGAYRKWYGNSEYVVNWENDGAEMKAYTSTLPEGMNVRLKSREYYFKECYSWSKISSGQISFRYYPTGFAFDVAGLLCVCSVEIICYIFRIVKFCCYKYFSKLYQSYNEL